MLQWICKGTKLYFFSGCDFTVLTMLREVLCVRRPWLAPWLRTLLLGCTNFSADFTEMHGCAEL